MLCYRRVVNKVCVRPAQPASKSIVVDHLVVSQLLSSPNLKQVILSLFAGTDTTAVTLTRLLQLLATADGGKEIVDRLLKSLATTLRAMTASLMTLQGQAAAAHREPGSWERFLSSTQSSLRPFGEIIKHDNSPRPIPRLAPYTLAQVCNFLPGAGRTICFLRQAGISKAICTWW